MKIKPLIILGAGNSTREIIDQINDINKKTSNKIEIIGVLDDDKKLLNKKISNIPIIGKINDFKKFKKVNFFLGILSPQNRFKRSNLIRSLKSNIKKFINIIHPSSIIGSNVKMGQGCLVSNNCNIYSGVSIGNFCNISPNVSLAPKAKIEDNCFLGNGVIATYKSTIQKNTYLSIRSVVLENIKVMEGSKVLSNTLVHKNFNKKNGIIFGEPSRLIGFEN